ncbi:MAG TPA: branched-chain amino acid ABC transporter ATP-binding protein/permease [Ramlibacter sp.]|nr:branched-chain amino acid ABC transporter ATP-binding protein/permease [Ramlibacter sp.]
MRKTTILLVGVIAIAAASTLLTPYLSGLALTAIAFAILGLSVNLVYGYLGYLSFGHAAFSGLGAYGAGLLYVQLGIPFSVAAPLALVPPVVLGALVGFASLRVGGAYFAIATLASAEILRLISTSWVSLTRGPLGVVVPLPGIDWLDGLGLQFHQYHLWIAIALLSTVLLGMRRLMASPIGRSWLAIRESIALAESVGIPTLRVRVVNIALSGGLAGLAGVLLVPKVLVLSPDLFNPSYSAIGLLIVILGGRGTLVGPLIGGLVFAVLPETLRTIDEYRMIIFAGLLLLAVRTQSHGIVKLLEPLWKRKTPVMPIASVEVAALSTNLPVSLSRAAVAPDGPVLRVRKLEKRYAGVRAVDGSHFDVQRREIFGVMGPNGAGKTTLLKLVSGFELPTAGEIHAFGRPVAALAPHQLAALGVVRTFQHTELYKGLSVVENVMTGTYLVGKVSLWRALIGGAEFRRSEVERSSVARHAMHLVGLLGKQHMRADELSYGEQKLLSIALALAAGPRLLLLDEPAAGLNHSEADQLQGTLQRLRDEGLTIVLVDHNLKLMMSVCDRMLVVNHGVPIAVGTPKQVSENPQVREAYLG